MGRCEGREPEPARGAAIPVWLQPIDITNFVPDDGEVSPSEVAHLTKDIQVEVPTTPTPKLDHNNNAERCDWGRFPEHIEWAEYHRKPCLGNFIRFQERLL